MIDIPGYYGFFHLRGMLPSGILNRKSGLLSVDRLGEVKPLIINRDISDGKLAYP